MHCCGSIALLIARSLFAVLFIVSGLSKFIDWDQTSQFMASKGMVAIPFFQASAGILELVGGLALLVGFQTRLVAFALFLFLIPTTTIFHDFWNSTTPEEEILQQMHFLKNLAIMGGLLALVTAGAGKYALDNKDCCSGEACLK